jgi:hypothetical protein
MDAENFVNANSSNITGTLYYWRKTNNTNMLNSYCTWTTAGFVSNGEAQVSDTNGIIRTGQGFFVEALNSATTVNFTNAMRVNDTANQFLRVAAVERHRIWLNATNTNGAFSQMLVGYMAGATNGVDPKIDGRYINDGVIALNSLISGVQYAIQGRALPFTPTDVVPLSFTATTAGSYTIAIDHVDGIFVNPNKKVYLKDNQTNTRHDLRLGSYTFTATSGTTTSRFELVFQTTYFQDVDGDGYGNNAVSQLSDTQPTGYVLNNTDCDDTNGAIHASFSFYSDTDLDGFGTGNLVNGVCAVNATTPPIGYSLNNTDCSPSDGLTYQSATVYVDADADGYSVGSATLLCYGASLPAGYSVTSLGSDCDDTNGAVNPGHSEVLYNGIDDNCNGQLDNSKLR